MIKKLGQRKKIGMLLLMLPILLLFLFCTKNVAAAGNQFTLGPLPTPRAEVPTGINRNRYYRGSVYLLPIRLGTVDHIVLSNDIVFSDAEGLTISGYSLNRSLQIEGNGHKISFTGNSLAGFLNLSTTATADHTFHLKNIQFEKTANDTLNILINGGNSHWEYIYDDLTINTGVRFACLDYGKLICFSEIL